jgi:hypothetical protein
VIPESEIRVVTPNDVILGSESRSATAAAKLFPFLEQPGNKTNITVAQNATVMFMIVWNVFIFPVEDIII